ncbi:hypothetical protein G7Y79_00046g082180 [Physcia stellaris]|nr:hypothetical protein G7Y79_00046g082180 [Physcia stellaris]
MEYEVLYGRTMAHRTASGSVGEERPAEEVYHTLEDPEHQCIEIDEDGMVQEPEEKASLGNEGICIAYVTHTSVAITSAPNPLTSSSLDHSPRATSKFSPKALQEPYSHPYSYSGNQSLNGKSEELATSKFSPKARSPTTSGTATWWVNSRTRPTAYTATSQRRSVLPIRAIRALELTRQDYHAITGNEAPVTPADSSYEIQYHSLQLELVKMMVWEQGSLRVPKLVCVGPFENGWDDWTPPDPSLRVIKAESL